MGSPIDTWEGAGAYFTGAGGSSPMILLIISVALCVGLIVHGYIHEKHIYDQHK